MRIQTRRAFAALCLLPLLFAGCLSSNGNAGKTNAVLSGGAAAPPVLPTLPANATPATSFPLTVKRSDGKDLVIKAQPKRLISMSAGTTEIFYAIGAQAQLVATDTYSDYPAEAAKTAKLDAFRPSSEAIAGLQPDLVVIPDDQQQIVEQLDGLNIPTLYLKVPASIAELLQQMQFYGDVTGHPLEAQRVAAGMRSRIDAINRKLTDVTHGPRVYHELDPKLFSVAPDSFVGDLYTVLKAQNIVPMGDKPYPQITQEFIIAKDPEVIVIADAPSGETPETVKGRAGWAGISAVKNARVYTIDTNLVSRPGPRIVDGLETLAKMLYPDRF
ncbi:MAG: ABC transporter substrate-binding protein [Dehalococcoidia bacterium]